MRLVDECQAEGFARKVAFDVFARLIADHPQRELQPPQRFLQACRLFVVEDELAVAVAEVDEVVDVVIHDAGQCFHAEYADQPVGTDLADAR